MRHARGIVTIVATLLSVACTDASTSSGAIAGTLVMSLTTPSADDGALLFQLTGPGIDGVTAIDESLHLFTSRLNDSTISGVVVGTLLSGPVVNVHVADVGAAAGYRATVIEVADRHDVLRALLVGYSLTLTQ